MPLPRPVDLKWFEEHRCQWCGKKCRPRYDRVCTKCGHAWFQHTLLLDGHCAGKRELVTARHLPLVDCDCQEKGDLKANPTAFGKRLLGYGFDDKGFFCKLNCAASWAQYQANQSMKDR